MTPTPPYRTRPFAQPSMARVLFDRQKEIRREVCRLRSRERRLPRGTDLRLSLHAQIESLLEEARGLRERRKWCRIEEGLREQLQA